MWERKAVSLLLRCTQAGIVPWVPYFLLLPCSRMQPYLGTLPLNGEWEGLDQEEKEVQTEKGTLRHDMEAGKRGQEGKLECLYAVGETE